MNESMTPTSALDLAVFLGQRVSVDSTWVAVIATPDTGVHDSIAVV